MARMIPPQPREDTEAAAEELLFARLANDLPGDYTVLHGVEWSHGRDLGDYEADYVVAHPVHGVLVLEVKGGLISVAADTATWYSEDLFGKRHVLKVSPFRQARRIMYALRDLLESNPSTRPYAYGVVRAVVFPDTVVDPRDFPTEPDVRIIDRHDLAKLRPAVDAAWGDSASSSPNPGREGIDVLIRLLSGSHTPTLRDRMAWESEEVQRHTEEQRVILDTVADFKRVAISGVAGAGKTTLALELCTRAARSGKRVLFTCHNQPLATFVRQALTRNLGPLMQDVLVSNYHTLAHDFARRAGLDVPEKLPFGPGYENFYENVLPEHFYTAVQLFPENRFDTIVVDEGQDFTDAWWITLESLLAEPLESCWFIFYDESQRIFSMQGSYPIPRPHLRLTRNCRNTQGIHKAVMAYSRDAGESLCLGPKGRVPIEIPIPPGGELPALRKVLHQLVVEERIPLADIVVISLCMHTDSSLQEGEPLGNFTLSWKTVPRGAQDTVRCRSIYSFKGLESPVVILAQLDHVDPERRGPLLYTAISRAQHHLIVLGNLVP